MNLASWKKAQLVALIERERAERQEERDRHGEYCRKLQERVDTLETTDYAALAEQRDTLRDVIKDVRAYLEECNAPLDLPPFVRSRVAYEEQLATLDDALTVPS